MRRIAIVQSIIADYRVEFYRKLHMRLADRACALTVFASTAKTGAGFRDGLATLSFGEAVPRFDLIGKAYWQGAWRRLLSYDLVIVEQANAALLNYALLVSRGLAGRPKRIAFWGHGATLQAENTGPLRTGLKRVMTRTPNHWFAYTQMSADLVAAARFPRDKITIVNNSADVSEIAAAAEEARRIGREAGRAALGLEPGFTAVFCSRLYAGKKLEFLVEAAKIAQRRVSGFRLVIIGDGPEGAWLRAQTRDLPWVRMTGALYGREKARYLAAADVMLLPAFGGLSILDGFAAALPVISAAFGNHGPEICYLSPGENGLMTEPDPEAYAAAIASLYEDPSWRAGMAQAARETAERHSLDKMVERFEKGVADAISASV